MTVPTDPSPGPPAALIRALVDGPSVLSGLEYHPVATSTNLLAVAAAARGVAEVHAVVADTQTAGRGRRGRSWHAPAGTSLLLSLVLRPTVAPEQRGLLSLLTGLALADTVAAYAAQANVAVKWPNDVLAGGHKLAGVLLESVVDGLILGLGCNVDWRGLDRPAGLDAVSVAEIAGGEVDRWRLLAGFIGVFGQRYANWSRDPLGFLDDYRSRCVTIGAAVTVSQPGRPPLVGSATVVGDDGALTIVTSTGEQHQVVAGDVVHVRPAPTEQSANRSLLAPSHQQPDQE